MGRSSRTPFSVTINCILLMVLRPLGVANVQMRFCVKVDWGEVC
jgi:hypothetical protein